MGSTEIDVMILDNLKRRLESEPLIPAESRFLLTTNSSLVPSTSVSGSFQAELNSSAYIRYFDRPEVQKAYREQQIIQTPEFTQLDEDANVGGRFRPRGAEDESADTSDAMYEKRHRKYETFEKRQRLREKEKLKHEQYKLKERMEQLRAMDTPAFLTLPASDFPVTSDEPPEVIPEDDTEYNDIQGAPTTISAAHIEGERRRKLMLDIALSLEERYRTLLPPDRRWLEKKNNKPESISASGGTPAARQSIPIEVEEEGEEEIDELMESDEEPVKEPPPKPYHDEDGESEVDFEARERERSKGLKLRIKFPPRTPSQLKDALAKQASAKKKQSTLSPFLAKHAAETPRTDTHARVISTASSIVTAPAGPVRVRDADGRFLSKNKSSSAESASAKLPPKKKYRTDGASRAESISAVGRTLSRGSPSIGKGHASYAGAAGRPEPTTCVLMISAMRNSAAPNVRKTQRHITAFGARVPQELEEVRDFEIPHWVLAGAQSGSQDGWDNESDDDPYFNGQPWNGQGNGFFNKIKRESPSSAPSVGGPPPGPDDDDRVQITVLEE